MAKIKSKSCSGTDTWTFTARVGTSDWRYTWSFDGTVTKTGSRVSFKAWAWTSPPSHTIVLTVTGKKGQDQAYTTVTTPCP